MPSDAPPAFAEIVVAQECADAPGPPPAEAMARHDRRSAAIEIEVDAIRLRLRNDADPKLAAAIIRALKDAP